MPRFSFVAEFFVLFMETNEKWIPLQGSQYLKYLKASDKLFSIKKLVLNQKEKVD